MFFFLSKCYEKGWEGAALGPKPTGAIKDWPELILRASEGKILKKK